MTFVRLDKTAIQKKLNQFSAISSTVVNSGSDSFPSDHAKLTHEVQTYNYIQH